MSLQPTSGGSSAIANQHEAFDVDPSQQLLLRQTHSKLRPGIPRPESSYGKKGRHAPQLDDFYRKTENEDLNVKNEKQSEPIVQILDFEKSND